MYFTGLPLHKLCIHSEIVQCLEYSYFNSDNLIRKDDFTPLWCFKKVALYQQHCMVRASFTARHIHILFMKDSKAIN